MCGGGSTRSNPIRGHAEELAIDLWVTGDGTIFPVRIGDNNSRRDGFNHLPRVSEPGLPPFENNCSTELDCNVFFIVCATWNAPIIRDILNGLCDAGAVTMSLRGPDHVYSVASDTKCGSSTLSRCLLRSQSYPSSSLRRPPWSHWKVN